MRNIYRDLENGMVKYKDLIAIKNIENDEPFIVINKEILTKGKIKVRKEAFNKLVKAQKILSVKNSLFSLQVTYGYRSLIIQKKMFVKVLRNISKKFFEDPSELYEEVHRYVAVPNVAGHPTGGAVDIIIVNKQTDKSIDFGSKQYDFSNKDCYVFAPGISKRGQKNRQLLRDVMLAAGFAPFDGEWWHFSYGDREWAYYYKKKNAIYDQVKLL